MKIARCADAGQTFWGLVDVEAKTVRPIAGAFQDWAPALTRGEGEAALSLVGEARPLGAVRLLPPVERSRFQGLCAAP